MLQPDQNAKTSPIKPIQKKANQQKGRSGDDSGDELTEIRDKVIGQSDS